jgi:hypothetical protein
MNKFYDSSMHFETKATSTKKVFTIKFPIDLLLSLKWDEEELKVLQELDDSTKVSDKLIMLSMIAKQQEERYGDEQE